MSPTTYSKYTPRKKIKIWGKKHYGTYEKDGSILTTLKSLIKIWLWFFREDFHIKIYYLMLHHILSHYG
jgi:hypothetical protein